MRVKAYIPGTENVLVGEYIEDFSYIRLDNGAELGLSFKQKWVIEPILELPTKRDALVRYRDGGGFNNTAWRADVDTGYPWIDGGGNFSDEDLLEEIKLHSDGKFEIIFEGLDD